MKLQPTPEGSRWQRISVGSVAIAARGVATAIVGGVHRRCIGAVVARGCESRGGYSGQYQKANHFLPLLA
jgi:hypothetical protein